MSQPPKDYGTNNEKAFTDDCPAGGKHFWGGGKNLGRCYELYICTKCGAKHKIDSSD